HCVFRDHDATDRLARRTVRHQVHISVLGGRLHAHIDPLRCGDEPRTARSLSRIAGYLRRRADTPVAGDALADQSAGAAWPRDGRVRYRHDHWSYERPATRRLA